MFSREELKRRELLGGIGLTLGSVALGRKTAMADTSTGSEKEIVYKETPQGILKMYAQFPKGWNKRDKRTAVIFFHGGGWGGGSRDLFKYQCAYFASRGIVAATVTYRLATKKATATMKDKGSRKRLCIPDAKSAIRWVKQHAEELGVDPDRIIVSGGSAGGHIGLIATSNPALNHPDDPEGFDTSVAAMVLFNPALTLADAKDSEIDFIQHLKPGAPPAIAFFGSKDKWLKGWNPTYAKWKSLEKSVIEVQIAEGQNHAFFNSQPWADLTLVAADEFLQKQGLLKGAPTLPKPPGGERLEPAAE